MADRDGWLPLLPSGQPAHVPPAARHTKRPIINVPTALPQGGPWSAAARNYAPYDQAIGKRFGGRRSTGPNEARHGIDEHMTHGMGTKDAAQMRDNRQNYRHSIGAPADEQQGLDESGEQRQDQEGGGIYNVLPNLVVRHYTQRMGWWRGRQWGRILVSEFLSTLIFAFAVQTLEAVGAPVGAAALAGGFLMAAIIEGFAGESGAHIHSIVTFALYLVGQADLAMLVLYVLAIHPAANLVGTLLVWAVLPASTGLGVPLIGVGISLGRAFAFELLGSLFYVLTYYVLVFVRPYAQPPGLLGYANGCSAGLTFSGAQHYGALAQFASCCPSLLIGFVYAALALAGRLISGAAFSLWRFLWPYVLSRGHVSGVRGVDFWVYLVAPPLGALAAWGLLWLHRYLFRRRARELHFRYLDYVEGTRGPQEEEEAEDNQMPYPTQPVDYLQTLPHGYGAGSTEGHRASHSTLSQ